MSKLIDRDPFLMNISMQQIRHMAQQLLNAIDACPGTVTLANKVIKKGTGKKSQRSREELQRIVENKFRKKYHF